MVGFWMQTEFIKFNPTTFNTTLHYTTSIYTEKEGRKKWIILEKKVREMCREKFGPSYFASLCFSSSHSCYYYMQIEV